VSWLRIEGRMPQHRKVAPLSDRAFRLHVTAKCWCVEQESDGIVPADIPSTLTAAPRGKALKDTIAELVKAQLWHETDGGYRIHDFLQYNPSHAQQEASRAATKRRVQQHRERAGNAVGNGVTGALVAPTPNPIPIPIPDPIQPTNTNSRPDRSPAPEPPPKSVVVAVDFTDSEQFTPCPLDLHERAEKLGVIAELADKLRVAPESLRAEAKEYVEHWTITAPGERRNRWMSHLRRRLVKRAKTGELKPVGALEHERSASSRGGLPPGWSKHPAIAGLYLDDQGQTRRQLPPEYRKEAS
jgi:hypothetical protein